MKKGYRGLFFLAALLGRSESINSETMSAFLLLAMNALAVRYVALLGSLTG